MADVPAGWVTYRYAAVMDRFHLTPAHLATLTDYQLDALYAYPRTPEGVLVALKLPAPPPAPPTAAGRLRAIDALEADGTITAANAAELRKQVRGEP